ncbi:MAG: helix-turn-helix domain-containing protein [Candidatus Shapirobacteria bacterium]
MVSKFMEELLTLKETAQILKVHPNTLRLWDNNGVLKAVRIGVKKIRKYRKKDIENFINKK